jgi:hypothetical protein
MDELLEDGVLRVGVLGARVRRSEHFGRMCQGTRGVDSGRAAASASEVGVLAADDMRRICSCHPRMIQPRSFHLGSHKCK